MHSTHLFGLGHRAGSRQGSGDHAGLHQIRQTAVYHQRDLHVLSRLLLHHADAALREENGDHRQRDSEIAGIPDLSRPLRSSNHSVLRDRAVHADPGRLCHLYDHRQRLQPSLCIRHACMRTVSDSYAEDGGSRRWQEEKEHQ